MTDIPSDMEEGKLYLGISQSTQKWLDDSTSLYVCQITKDAIPLYKYIKRSNGLVEVKLSIVSILPFWETTAVSVISYVASENSRSTCNITLLHSVIETQIRQLLYPIRKSSVDIDLRNHV